ncbi:MAG: hypothetical protein P1U74_06610 [Legionellaceae bacterium]|nr:hypothetical protein [Legionellaceae bacterium]
MNKFTDYDKPGTHTFLIEGEVGNLEVELIIPNSADFRYCAILGHPHPLHGGTMGNKVVTTLAASFKNNNIPSIKFNFRGVGQSSGEYDAGIGESLDMLIVAKLWKNLFPDCKILFAGFSFGSFVAYRAAAIYIDSLQEQTALITIAPSVVNYDYKEFSISSTPWLVVQGDVDEVVSADDVYEFVEKFNPPLPLLRFPDTGHFFHGKLIELKSQLTEYISKQLVKS